MITYADDKSELLDETHKMFVTLLACSTCKHNDSCATHQEMKATFDNALEVIHDIAKKEAALSEAQIVRL